MIQPGTIIRICDNTGVIFATCIKVLGHSKKRIAYLGDVIVVAVKYINPKKFLNVKEFQRKKFLKGTVHRALLVRTKWNYCRLTGLFIRFSDNSGVIVSKTLIPLSNRLYGPVLREVCTKFPSIGCITRIMI